MQSIIDFFACSLRSKTMWFNAIIAALLALEPVFGVLASVLPGNVYAISSVTLVMGNAVLRTLTTMPLAAK